MHGHQSYLDKVFSDTLLQVKESKEKAMTVLNSYRIAGSHDVHDSNVLSQQAIETGALPFVSLLEFVSEIYQVCCLFDSVIVTTIG